MADSEMISRQAQDGWKAFCLFLTLGTVAVIVLLVLMAIFLL
tara:strand:- start:958 stop:1083 length:126 start_codon:yes stop_codon:yes gene_type:complete